MRTAWGAFAATGDPGWPAYDPDRRLVRLFDVHPETAAYPEEASRRLWEHYTFGPLPLLIHNLVGREEGSHDHGDIPQIRVGLDTFEDQVDRGTPG